MRVHADFAAALEACWSAIRTIQQRRARANGVKRRPALARHRPSHAEGVDGAEDGRRRAGRGDVPRAPGPARGRARQPRAPADARGVDEELRARRRSSTTRAGSSAELAALAPSGARRMGANPHANGGALRVPLDAARLHVVRDPRPGARHGAPRVDAPARRDAARHLHAERRKTFRLFCPDETNSNRLGAVFEVENRCLVEPTFDFDDHVSPDGRVMEVLSEHNCQGWLEGYLLTGRHGLFATYEAFALIVASMATQHAKWLEACDHAAVAQADRLAQLPSHVDLLAQRPQRLQPPGPRLHGHDRVQEGDRGARLPAAGRELPALGRGPLPAQRELREPHHHRQAAAAAVARHGRGARALRARARRSGRGPGPRTPGEEPDVVLACAGRHADARDRGGGVVAPQARAGASRARRQRRRPAEPLLAARAPARHDRRALRRALHARTRTWSSRSTATRRRVHQLLHARPEPTRFHVRGYKEEGTTTTPFDMVVLNQTSRYDICMDALRRSRRQLAGRGRAHRELPSECSRGIAPTSTSTSRTCRRSATGRGPRSEPRRH